MHACNVNVNFHFLVVFLTSFPELIVHYVTCQRVLYVDIDVHHGDGVEEAFYTTDRVMSDDSVISQVRR
jgi:hypothetical protein